MFNWLLEVRPPRVPRAEACWWQRVVFAVVVSGLAACGGKKGEANRGEMADKRPATEEIGELSRQLSVSRLGAARDKMRTGAVDEALAWAAAAVNADPGSVEAAELVRKLLGEVRWPVTLWELPHGLKVEKLACGEGGVLWVALATDGAAGGQHTVVRWNVARMRQDAVMFPSKDGGVRELLAAPRGPALVVTRGGDAGRVRLLCAADTLRPVAELGAPPPGLTPEAVTVVGANGLLLAGPEIDPSDPKRTIWRIRDAASGGVIRSSDPVGPETPAPVAAWLDGKSLRIVLKDGSLAVVPVSPVEPCVLHRPQEAVSLAQARFAKDGMTVLGLWESGAGRLPQRHVASYELVTSESEDARVIWRQRSDTPDAAWWEVPWSSHPSWWDSLLRDHGDAADAPAVVIDGARLIYADGRRAPLRESSALTALAFQDGTVVTANSEGVVRGTGWLALPQAVGEGAGPIGNPAELARLSAGLSGFRFDDRAAVLTPVSAAERRQLIAGIPASAATRLVPGLDLKNICAAASVAPVTASAAAWQPLWDRLARADASAGSWPRLLELGLALGDSRWHQDLKEELALRQQGTSAAMPGEARHDDSPWQARRRMLAAFASDDDAAFEASLKAADGKGLVVAAAFAMALDGDRPARIAACLEVATDMPPLLRALGSSRIAWLEKRTGDALSLWPDEFPDLAVVRRVQDWDGWEQEDFAARYQAHAAELLGEFARYDVARAKTAEERELSAGLLLSGTARQTLGRRRLAELCLKGAVTLAEKEEAAETIRQLAKRARDTGGDPAPSLRHEALACNRMKRFDEALPLWVELIGELPPETHLASDYTEAAYTAFEAHNPRQAMDILTTGVRRFGNDPDFALQAGWVGLLTGNHGRAYQFLLAGLRAGFADEVRENAQLLLAVGAALAGFPEDAAIHYLNLLEQDEAWDDPATVETLDWPEELKDALRQLVSGQGQGHGEMVPDVQLPDDVPVLPDL